MRRKLEQEYLAESLRGRIQYFATNYRKSHDEEGRTAIRLDGKEILRGNFYQCDRYHYPTPDDRVLDLGAFDQWAFYAAFREFDNQSIEKSLRSDNLIVRILAILDRRVGKRRLLQMRETIERESKHFPRFYAIRMQAEGLQENTLHQRSVEK